MRALIPLVALAVLATPAAAQFSDSYNFLKAVRDADGNKATALLNKPGSTTVDARDGTTGETALHIVVKRRDTVWLNFLLSRGAKPDVRDASGVAPLLLATRLGWADGVSLLIDRRATVDVAGPTGETPLMRAVQQRDLTLVKLLLAAGANPKKVDTGSGQSARDYAVRDPRAGAILREIDAAAPRRKATIGPN